MKYKVFVPTYKRAAVIDKSVAIGLENVYFCVCEDDYEAYSQRLQKKTLLTITNKIEGVLARKRNYILDNFWDDSDFVVMIDDDVREIKFSITEEFLYYEEIDELFQNMFRIMEFLNVSIAAISDTFRFRNGIYSNPFSLTGLISSALIIIRNKYLRYDENLFMREDVDLTMQGIYADGRVLKNNLYSLTLASHGKGSGGDRLNTLPTKLKHDEDYLINKWGKNDLLFRLLKDNPYGGGYV